MCGFGGVVLRSAGSVEERLLARMGRVLGHRGPDGTHTMSADGAGFVHCRLAIIDLSARANQPLARPDLGAVLAFNGEIYNFRELRSDLEKNGTRFDTESDSEVLLAALVRGGPDALRALRGMFALAVFWPAERRLLLARDALGKKPLFYAWREDGALVFGSTLAAILEALGKTPALSDAAIGHYLAHTVVPQEHVIYAGVHRVQPGEWIAFTGATETGRGHFWEPAVDPRWAGSAEELDREIERTLRLAVRRRLVGDVPVGAFLSAGIDSGTIVGLMAAEAGEPVLTFTAGSRGDPNDERPAARSVAERYGTRHTEVEVPPLSAEALPRLLHQCGEPFGDASLLPTARVAEATRRHATVVLTGDGGDELFFGYPVFNGVRLAERLRALAPGGALAALRRVAGDDRTGGPRNKLDALLEYASAPIAQAFRNRMGWSFDARRRLLQQPEPERAETIYAERLAKFAHLPDADALRRTLLGTWLPNDYLVKVDVATMAVALEARSPFLDVDLVDLLLSVPERMAFPGGERKALLRPLARRLLPESILRRPKSGFGVPIRSWLLGSLREPYERFVTRPGLAIHEWIRPDAARDAYAELERGSARADRVWLLLTLGVWAAVSLDRTLSPEEPLAG
jgi:asparagine synthase (glutamine-hydrolysing)